MTRLLLCATVFAALPMMAAADSNDRIVSAGASADTALSADPGTPFWKSAPEVLANRDNLGNPIPNDVMRVRSRWTAHNLYLLFSCHFSSLNLKPGPVTAQETNALWNWDVAEAFIGDDFKHINLYKEFEVSPQAEWVDLDIDSSKLGGSPDAWHWNSGFKVNARIDRAKKIWYAEMCIPFQAISHQPPAPGLQLRINFFRAEGKDPNRLLETWRPTHSPTFHVPGAFGIIQLAPLGGLRE